MRKSDWNYKRLKRRRERNYKRLMGNPPWYYRQVKKKRRDGKKDGRLGFVISAGIVFLLLALLVVIKSREDTEEYEYCQEYVMTEELPELMSFCYFSSSEWQDKIEEEEFGGVVTLEMLKWLTAQTGTGEYVALPEGKDKYVVTRNEFNQVYDQFLDLLDVKGEVKIADDILLKQEENTYIMANGTYTCNIEFPFVNLMKSYEFYVKGDDVIGIRNFKGTSSAIKNAYLLEETGEKISFLYAGETYEISMEQWQPQGVGGQVCDLVWEAGELSKIQLKEERIQGNLIAVDESRIQIEGYGDIKRSENLPVYKTYGTVEEKKLSDIIIANMNVEYVVAEDRVEAILLMEPAQISRIRVLLLGDDAGIYRQQVFLTCSTPYKIGKTSGEERIEAETVVNAQDLFAGTEDASIRFSPEEETGELFICNEKGEKISLGYEGILELYRYQEGYTLISELSLEDYLCSVVPSEMPSSYGIEALKAQAVCARSYVYIQLEKGAYAALGAHVDDSTNYQVYNKQERNEITSNAVWDTAGQVLKYQGEIAEAYYFSTSSGITGNGESWGLDTDPVYGYLHSVRLKDEQEAVDFSNEDVFREYIRSNEESYDDFSPFYRWEEVCNYSDTACQEKISGILAARKEKVPDSVTIFNGKGKEVKSTKKLGGLLKISVQKRSACGVILELCLEYEKGKVILSNEYNIRAVLGTGRKSLTLKDGSVREDFSLLPSAFAAVVPVENGDYHIYGGGYGHGIGMSQNGAQKMAENGKTYQEILMFFFRDIEIAPVS